MTRATILIVDDEPHMRRVLEMMLDGFGHRALSVSGAEEALGVLGREHVDLVFTDLQLGAMSGLDLLPLVRKGWPDVTVVLMTAYATIESAVQAIKAGAYDYLVKPFRIEEIEAIVGHALALRDAQRENAYLKEVAAAPFEGLVGESASMRRVFTLIGRVAPSTSTVLVTGETGTGKELVARAIHARSPRASRLFVAVNCAAIPGELLEAELFGVLRGAFTGATRDRAGKFELADGGTLFLDEVGDMPLEMQAKLLRVLQERVVERLGSGVERPVDVRVIAATHRDLAAQVRAGRFREDLMYRLAVIPIELPPLRDRRDDIAPIARAAVARLAARSGRQLTLSAAAIARLELYDWPGNVRELHNILERAVLLASGSALGDGDFADLPARSTPDSSAPPDVDPAATLVEVVAAAERAAIVHALRVTHDNKTHAADRLGVSVRTLWYKLRRLGIAGAGADESDADDSPAA